MSPTPTVTPDEAARLMAEQSYVYLDVRRPDELEAGHPKGAFNIPWELAPNTEPNPDFLALVRANFSDAPGIIIGCQTGRRSRAAGDFLRANGVDRVVDQTAGWAGKKDAFGKLLTPGWERAGLPVGYQADPGHSYDDLRSKGSAG